MVSAIDRDEPPKIAEWVRAVVDAQIEPAISPWLARTRAGHHEHGRRLPASHVTSGRLGCIERGK